MVYVPAAALAGMVCGTLGGWKWEYTWGQLATTGTKPSARHGQSSILYNGQTVMFGGRDDSDSNKNDAWILDLTSYAWTQLTTTGTE